MGCSISVSMCADGPLWSPGAKYEILPIEQSLLVLVEGRPDQALIYHLCRAMGIEDVHIRDMNGKDSWGPDLRALTKDRGFRSHVTALGLIQDADSTPNAAWQRCASALNVAGLATPTGPGLVATQGSISTAIAILPSHDQQGTIETAFLASLPNNDRRAFADAYIEQVSQIGELQNSDKSTVAAYLAGLPGDMRSLTVAFRYPEVVDVMHDAFAQCRTLLDGLRAVSGV